MSDWLPAADYSELARRKKLQVTVGGQTIGLFMIDGDVFALRDSCVHKNRPLSKGTVLNGRIVCPGHQWAFDPETGRVDDRAECQPVHDVRVIDGAVYVDPRPRVLEPETTEAL